MKLAILVFAAHPDDAELSCSGTILQQISLGHRVGVIDLTKGELGTRGSVETRAAEAKAAAEILKLSIRENLGLPDGAIANVPEQQLPIIEAIRAYQPDIVLCNAIEDRHPDHGNAAKLVSESCFLAGLQKIETKKDGAIQAAWRPKAVYHYIQDRWIEPDFIVDISAHWKEKEACILAYKSQFYDPNSKEPATYIASENFLKTVEARALELGKAIGAQYGEGFTAERFIGVRSLMDLQ